MDVLVHSQPVQFSEGGGSQVFPSLLSLVGIVADARSLDRQALFGSHCVLGTFGQVFGFLPRGGLCHEVRGKLLRIVRRFA